MRRIPNALTFALPSFQDVLYLACLAACMLMGERMVNIDSDLGRHLALGRYMLAHAEVPAHDLLSHTLAGVSRPPYEWLSQLLFTLSFHTTGLDGVVWLSGVIIASAHAIVYAQSVRRSSLPMLSMGVSILAVAAASLHWLPRPHVLTLLLLPLWLQGLEDLRRGTPPPWWQLPALMALWSNLHGGFVFGFLTWLAYLAGELWPVGAEPDPQRLKRVGAFLKLGALSALASGLTPAGFRNWEAVAGNSSRYILGRTVETMPVDFSQAWAWPFLALLLLTALAFALDRRATPPGHLLLAGGLALAGLLIRRNIPLFALAATPLVAEHLRGALAAPVWQRIEGRLADLQAPLRGALWPVLLTAGLAAGLAIRAASGTPARVQFSARVFPVAAADWLARHPQEGGMFNELNWGGYLLHRGWPPERVFIDSQTDFYGEALVREYEQALTARPGWEAVLARYEVDWAIIPPGSGLAQALAGHPGWRVLYADSTSLVARRTGSATGAVP